MTKTPPKVPPKAPAKPKPVANPRPPATKAEQAAFKRKDRHVSKPMPKKH